jgi:hypothetical protein
MRALRVISQRPWRYMSTSTLGSPTPLSRSESLVKEMAPIRNFLLITTTIGTIGAYYWSRLEKLEERVAGLLREVDAKVVGVVNEVDAKVAGVTTVVDVKVANVMKEVDAKVAGAKEAADKTVRVGRTARPPAHPPTRSLTLLPPPPLCPPLPVRAPQVNGRVAGSFWSCAPGIDSRVFRV